MALYIFFAMAESSKEIIVRDFAVKPVTKAYNLGWRQTWLAWLPLGATTLLGIGITVLAGESVPVIYRHHAMMVGMWGFMSVAVFGNLPGRIAAMVD